jgi:hypothetical protein
MQSVVASGFTVALLFAVIGSFVAIMTDRPGASDWLHMVLPLLTYGVGVMCGYLFGAKPPPV